MGNNNSSSSSSSNRVIVIIIVLKVIIIIIIIVIVIIPFFKALRFGIWQQLWRHSDEIPMNYVEIPINYDGEIPMNNILAKFR